ncbi:MAG: hypothetical protein NC084_03175 [Bacteroides sp.]|nr:hypothetical protein [Eubacterium sp.]MCM1417591.1 hypothetical protein [Roseburia sp.]MCM1461698.1 hypothetical protein [Bacteroides sp.]
MSLKKKTAARLAALLGAASLCGCSVQVESLLSPPKLSEEQVAIYEALRVGRGGEIHLKYPRSGSYRSAFVIENIDDEETNEAIVFYEASNIADSGSSLRINFLDREDGEWVSVYDFAALGSEIERVQFADLGDGETSIIIVYSIQNAADSAVSVLKYADKTPTEVYTGRCAYTNLMDVNGDGHRVLFQISRDLDGGTATASLLGWGEAGAFEILSSAPLSGFADCKGVTLGVCDDEGSRAIFIDRSLADGSIGTDVLICDDELALFPVPTIPDVLSRRTNSYTPNILSRDIDGDGIIETASTAAFPGYENLARAEQVCLTAWYQVERRGASIKRDALSYISIRSDYLLFVPPRWEGRVTAKVSISEGTVTFSEYDSSKRTAGAELLSIRAVAGDAEPEGYTLFGESATTGYRFYIRNNTRNSLALTETELSDCFKILD